MKMGTKRLLRQTLCGVSPLAALTFLPCAAHAQQSAISAQDSLPEVTVTAQKSSSSLQRVPAAVTTVSGDDLVKQGVSDLMSFAQLAPSLNIEPIRTQTNIFIRGVGQTLTSPNSDPAVAVNINGAYVPTEMTGVSFFDLDRVEVLPGPQGTLYGRNAAGGVVNMITRRPGSDYAGEGFLEYGNFNRVQAFAAVDTPLSDNFSLRTALTAIKHDGYFSNGVDDQDTLGGRVTGVWKPSDQTTVTGIIGYIHDGGLGNIAQNIPPPGGKYWSLGFNPKTDGFKTSFSSTQSTVEVDQQITPTLNLTYVGGYNAVQSYQRTGFWAGPPIAPLTLDQSTVETSHEARLDGAWGKLSSMVGLYYFYDNSPYGGTLNPAPPVTVLDGPLVAESQGEAIFGQSTYSVLDDFRLTGGLRYGLTEKSLTGENTTTIATLPPSVDKYSGHAGYYRLDWKAGAEYDVTSNSMLYATVATGFSPGGFSAGSVSTTSSEAAPFAAMKMTGYTAGMKNKLLDGRIVANIEGFSYDYQNYQVSQRNPQTGENQVYNAAKADIYGGQIDLSFMPTALDRISVKPAYLWATARTLVTPAGNFDGYQLPYSPQWTVNSAYQHKFPLADGGTIIAAVDSQYAASQWGFYTHAAGGQISANTRTNIDITYHTPDSRWGLSLWARNLENSIVYTSGVSGTTPGPASFFAAPPRTYGLRLSVAY